MVDFKRSFLPVSLMECLFQTFTVEWDLDDQDNREPFPEEVTIDASIEHIHAERGHDVWAVHLDAVSMGEDEFDADDIDGDSADSQLFFDISVTGIFSSATLLDKENTAQVHAIIASEAAQTLLGIVRARLAQATAGSSYGVYYLPSVQLFIEPQEIKTVKIPRKSSGKKKETAVKKPAHLKIVKD